MRQRVGTAAAQRFPSKPAPSGKVWYTSTEGSHLAVSAAQRQRILDNLVAEGLERPAQYDDTPETLAALAEAADAAEKELAADAGLFRLRFGYAAAGFSTALINNVFILYHLKLYTSVYRVSDSWLYLVFLVYGIWNTLNDPLFGWIEDRAARGSLRNSLQRRLFALRVGGLLLSATFFALFTPWWDVSPAAPPPSPWLVGVHMLVCMSCYDAGLTWVCQAHNALLVELTVDNEERAVLGRYSSIAMMWGSSSALSAFYAWNNLSYQGYQTVCLGLALLGAAAFELSYWLLSATEAFNAPAADSWEAAAEGPGHSGDQAYGGSDDGSEGGGSKASASGRGGVISETIEFGRFARAAVQSRSLGLFLVFGLCQQLNCTFNTSFFPLMVEVLLVGELPGWVSTAVLLSSFVLPHFLTIFSTKLAGRLKECYPIIKTLNALKVLNAVGLLLGTTCFPLPPAQCGWLILTGMIINRNVTECGCRLSSLVLADIVDEDRAVHGRYVHTQSQSSSSAAAAPSRLHFAARPRCSHLLAHRSKPMSSSIAGLHAIASKPGQSLAPMIGWFVLRSAGYSAETATTVTVASPLLEDTAAVEGGAAVRDYGEPAATAEGHGGAPIPEGVVGAENGEVFDALLRLLIFLPGMVGVVQVCLWQTYKLHGVALGMYPTEVD